MTGPVSGGYERGTGAPSRSTGMQGTLGAILIVLALGLALRLILAYLLPGSGFDADLSSFRFWADNLADNGLYGFYQRDFFHDYTPGYLYVLWLVGTVGNALGGIGDLIKIPPILADLAVGYLVWSMIRELGGRERLALLGAVVVVVNPVFWFDNVVWGQVDSVGVVFVLLALRSLWRDQPERAADLYGHRGAREAPARDPGAARRRRDDPSGALAGRDLIPAASRTSAFQGDGLLDRVRAWEARTDHPLRILTTGVAGFLTAVLLCLPFGLSVLEPAASAPFFSVRADRPDRHRGRWISVPHGQRLQRLGGRAERPGQQPRQRRPVGLRRRVDTGGPVRRGRGGLRRRAGGRRGCGPADRVLRGRALGGRSPSRSTDAARGAGGPRARVLRPADPRARALRLPVLRVGRDPLRDLTALASRVRGPRHRDVRQHVRRPHHALSARVPRPERRPRLAGHRAVPPLTGRGDDRRDHAYGGVRLGRAPVASERPRTTRGRAGGGAARGRRARTIDPPRRGLPGGDPGPRWRPGHGRRIGLGRRERRRRMARGARCPRRRPGPRDRRRRRRGRRLDARPAHVEHACLARRQRPRRLDPGAPRRTPGAGGSEPDAPPARAAGDWTASTRGS